MSYGTDLGITLPSVGVTVGPTWATNLNTAIQALVDVLETKVTPSGIDVNADLSFRSGSTSYSATNVKSVQLTNQASALSAATYPTTLFSTDDDGELYYNDNAGRQVQMTTNGAVNVSTSGGITGTGYGASSVEVNWDSGTTTYKMRSGAAADDYASVLCNDLKLNDGSANTLTIAAPAMGADYTMTLPSAVPATNNTVLTMSTAGAVAASATPTVTTLTTTGLITAGGGVTASADQNVTLSGTGRVVHGTRYFIINATDFQSAVPSRSHLRTDGRLIHDNLNNTDYFLSLPVPHQLNNATTIRNIEFHAIHTTGTSSREYSFSYSTLASTTMTAVETNTDTTSNATITVNVTTDHSLLTARRYYLRWKATEQNDTLLGVVITYDA